MIHIHYLAGCAPAPLAHYLKALGVLRLVAEQADPQARGWWEGERFRLATVLGREELLTFLLQQAEPVAIFNPWGGRSGYFSGNSEVSARAALNEIERSNDPRFSSFKKTIFIVRRCLESIDGGCKPKDQDKEHLIADLRASIRGNGLAWMGVVAAIRGGGDQPIRVTHPPLFGSGGNEGSGSYTSAYMQAVVTCMVKHENDPAVAGVIFGGPVVGLGTDQNMLQFQPEGAGSPWDFILAVTGAMFLQSSVISRSPGAVEQASASPFFVQPTAAGYASSSRMDERLLQKGAEKPGRGEQWFPLWSRPSTAGEVARIFVEGRASVGRKAARDGWSLALATKRMGVSHGISAFQRYGYLQRDNQALHFAVSLGRFSVVDGADSSSACLEDLTMWIQRLHDLAYPRKQDKTKSEATSFRIAYRDLTATLFETLNCQQSPRNWQALLLGLSRMELVQKSGSGFKAQPAPPLRPEWVEAADDGSPEFRLALSLALQARDFRHDTARPIDPVRRHWLPLDANRRQPRFAILGDAMHQRLDKRPDVVMQGRSGIDDAVALVERRLIEGTRLAGGAFGLRSAPRASASLADLSAWLQGRVDADRTLALARALMALDRDLWAEQIVRLSRSGDRGEWPDDAWLCIRLAHLPWPLRDGRHPPCDPAIARRLASGDAGRALQLALQRLHGAGIRPGLRAGNVDAGTARLWAAALAFPISQTTAERMASRLHIQLTQENLA